MPLTLVPTPLGNLRDITLRAIDALRDCDLLVAEDTRVARKLLHALGLPSKPAWSYREQSSPESLAAIVERARLESVVFTSDAGTPGISDPGRELVVAARAAGVAVEVLPGPVAFVCAAVLSGFPLGNLHFAGFVPRTARLREDALLEALRRDATTAFYEAPQRIVTTLETLETLAADRTCFVARELSKLHEQQILGTPAEVRAALPVPIRGEFVLVVAGSAVAPASEPADVDAMIDAELAAGRSPAAIAKRLAALGLASRNDLYGRTLARRKI